MGTVREANELLVHPDIIKNLRVGQCVLLRHNPTKLDLINLRSRKIEIVQEQEVAKNNEPKKEEKKVIKEVSEPTQQKAF